MRIGQLVGADHVSFLEAYQAETELPFGHAMPPTRQALAVREQVGEEHNHHKEHRVLVSSQKDLLRQFRHCQQARSRGSKVRVATLVDPLLAPVALLLAGMRSASVVGSGL